MENLALRDDKDDKNAILNFAESFTIFFLGIDVEELALRNDKSTILKPP